MQPQVYNWTCSACALTWVLTSAGLRASSGDVYQDRYDVGMEIGYPGNINSTYGLMDASGSALQDVYATYGQATQSEYLDYDTIYSLAQETTGQMSGGTWYHWVSLRGVQGSNIWIANSAPGYKGVYDILSRADFDRLGPFSVVWLTED